MPELRGSDIEIPYDLTSIHRDEAAGRHMTTYTRFGVLLIIVLLAIMYPRHAHADGQSELLLFELFPHSILQRRLLGLRFDLLKNQAITIELSRAETKSEEFDQAMLQWSSALP